MSDETLEIVSGSGKIVNPTSGALETPPAAQTKDVSLGQTWIKWLTDTRPVPEDDTPRSLDPYWEITEYPTEEFNAFLKADELSPELAEHYKEYLED
jgi:hypothetical protein